uniref:transposase n=1 Tax=Mycobacterium avium TaxID=1764 RepID=UPI001F4032AE
MALDQSALLEVLDALRTADAGERITQAAETIYQALIDAELTAFIGASPHERTETRSNQRNGSRPRTLSTVAGDLELRIPKLRTGSFFPALLERRRRVDQGLVDRFGGLSDPLTGIGGAQCVEHLQQGRLVQGHRDVPLGSDSWSFHPR